MQEGTICVCFSSAAKSLFFGRYEGGTSLVGSSISLGVSVSKSRAALAPPTCNQLCRLTVVSPETHSPNSYEK